MSGTSQSVNGQSFCRRTLGNFPAPANVSRLVSCPPTGSRPA
jgi:hypothetical protein